MSVKPVLLALGERQHEFGVLETHRDRVPPDLGSRDCWNAWGLCLREGRQTGCVCGHSAWALDADEASIIVHPGNEADPRHLMLIWRPFAPDFLRRLLQIEEMLDAMTSFVLANGVVVAWDLAMTVPRLRGVIL